MILASTRPIVTNTFINDQLSLPSSAARTSLSASDFVDLVVGASISPFFVSDSLAVLSTLSLFVTTLANGKNNGVGTGVGVFTRENALFVEVAKLLLSTSLALPVPLEGVDGFDGLGLTGGTGLVGSGSTGETGSVGSG